MHKKVICFILSFLYSTFLLIGTSFLISDSFAFLEKYLLLNIIGYLILLFVIYKLVNLLFTKLDKYQKRSDDTKGSKIVDLFLKHPFLFSLIFILICWLPYIIAYYPAILSPDPSFQIRQYFGIPNKYSTYSVMLDESVTITNHHPVIHTLLLGTCVKIGTLINNVNLGLFLYSLIQILILASTLAYTIKFLKDIKRPPQYLLLTLIIYAFVPAFPFYAMSAVKDVIFGSLIILYIISLYKLVKGNDLNTKDIIKIIVLLIFITLMRNNGIHTIILSFPFLFFLHKRLTTKLKIGLIFIVIILFNYSYNNLILPYFRVTPTSIREALSIPFQQTARYVKKYPLDVTEEEYQAIDYLLEYNTLASRYDSGKSDPVKNKFNRYYTDTDLKNYFVAWFSMFKRHPKVYVEATISNTYGYVYPLKTNWYIYHNFDKRITDNGFDYHYNNLYMLRTKLALIGVSFPYIPIIGLLVNIGFNVWLLIFMFMYLFYKRKYSDLIYLSPSLVLFLVCLASPVNAYFRYALPYVFALPLNTGIFLSVIELPKLKENAKIN